MGSGHHHLRAAPALHPRRGSVNEHGRHLAARLLELGSVEVGRHGGLIVRRECGRRIEVGWDGLQRVLLCVLGFEALEEAAQVL